MDHPSDHFYLNQSEPNRSCLLTLRSLILKQDSAISEAVKYGMPCFCYHKKILCYLWIDRKTLEPYILLADGNKMEHPDLEKGSRARMKILRVNPSKTLPLSKIEAVLRLALAVAKQPTRLSKR
jgi:Domain of unknown function (DU1801)